MHLVLNLDIGGGQAVVRTLVEYQAQNGWLPVVCSFKDGPLRHEIEAVGIPVELLQPRRYSILALPFFALDMFGIFQSLTRLVKQYQVQIVQTHLLHILDFLVLFLPLNTSLQAVIWTFHSANFILAAEHLPRYKWLLRPKQYVQRQIRKFASRMVSHIIAVSTQINDNLLQVFGPSLSGKITVIPNGVNTARYGGPVNRDGLRAALGLPPQSFLLAMVGTLKKVKGHTYTIQAVTNLAPLFPNLHVLFIGDGELRAELETQVTAAGLENRILFLGNRQDIPDLLSACDIFVLPSLWEGLSMALLEAMATGLPIVASAVSGTVQAITPGESGLLVPPGDVPALTQAIACLVEDPHYARTLGNNAQHLAQAEFSAQRQARAHIALYQKILGDINPCRD